MEKTTKVERVVTEILERVLGEQSVPVPRIEVDTDENVNLVYDLHKAPATSVPRPYQQRRNQTQNLLL